MPTALYGQTKLAAESTLARIATTQNIAFTAARFGIANGPWEYTTGVRDTPSPMLQILDLADRGEAVILDPPWRGDYTLSCDIASTLVTSKNMKATPRPVDNMAAGGATDAQDWCRVVQKRTGSLNWRRAGDGEAWNVDSHTGSDRGAMSIERIMADTAYRPGFDLDSAADHLLAWRKAQ